MENIAKALLDLDPKKSAILLVLAKEGSLTGKVLSEALGISRSNAWFHLQRLEKEGIISKFGKIGKNLFYIPTEEGRKLALSLVKVVLDSFYLKNEILLDGEVWVEAEVPKNVREALKILGVLEPNPLWKLYEDAKKEGKRLYVLRSPDLNFPFIVNWEIGEAPPGKGWIIHAPRKWIIRKSFLDALRKANMPIQKK